MALQYLALEILVQPRRFRLWKVKLRSLSALLMLMLGQYVLILKMLMRLYVPFN